VPNERNTNGLATRSDVELVSVGLQGCRMASDERHKRVMVEVGHVKVGLEEARKDIAAVRSDVGAIRSALDVQSGQQQALAGVARVGFRALPFVLKAIWFIVGAAILLSAGAGAGQLFARRNHVDPIHIQEEVEGPQEQGHTCADTAAARGRQQATP
jgi:Zn-dependent alcohol dehydrogenase